MKEQVKVRPNNEPKSRVKNPKNIKKKRKSKKFIKKFLILILILSAIIIFALITPIFNITEITVEGNQNVDTESIISLSGLNPGDNIFRNFKSKIIKSIRENPYIETVEMKRVLPSTVELIVKERIAEYQIKLVDGYVYISNQGYILEDSSNVLNVPILEGMSTTQDELLNGKRLNEEDLNRLNTILKIMDSIKTINKQNLITAISAEDVSRYILYLESENKYLYLGDGSNLNNKMLYLQMMLEEEKGKSGIMFLDGNLNQGFKPYFREEKIDKKS
ncbi:MAG: FtsQ-type POTRA domain-containing protein [Clostridia bacterium]|nr:FtsQ-type POTRA domain-containing protein [Clostridia bacterium]